MATKKHPYDQWCPDARALDVIGDKWTLLIVRDLLDRPVRFVDLQGRLPGISTEQLRSRLNTMVEAGLLTRERFREVPPRVDYSLTESGRALIPVLGAVARWGQAFAWGTPRPGEAFDLAAMFRLVPALLTPAKAIKGTVSLIADDDVATVTIQHGVVTVSDDYTVDADAIVTGSDDDWVLALGAGDRSELIVTGSSLGGLVLDALAGASVTELRQAA